MKPESGYVDIIIMKYTAILLFCVVSTVRAASITVAPGPSPAGGYLPLSLFGITPIAGMGNDTQTSFTVPSFTWGGVSFTSINVSSNGYLTMGDNATAFVNQVLPDPHGPNGVLAPYWADLDPTLGGAVRIGTLTDGTHTWIVVDWQNVPLLGQAAQINSFEAWMRIGGTEDVSFAYGQMSSGTTATVGAEALNGGIGSNYYYNGTGTLPVLGTQLVVSTTGAPNTVPEPASAVSFAGGLLSVALVWQRRRSKSRSV